jgi:hypothetical protein
VANRIKLRTWTTGVALTLAAACTTLPEVKHKNFEFPSNAFIHKPKRAYVPIGTVRTRVDFPSLDPLREEADLCRNYFNQAARELVKRAQEKGGAAVVEVRSVVFLADGRRETYPQPECADDGNEGQVLAEGLAVRWADGLP